MYSSRIWQLFPAQLLSASPRSAKGKWNSDACKLMDRATACPRDASLRSTSCWPTQCQAQNSWLTADHNRNSSLDKSNGWEGGRWADLRPSATSPIPPPIDLVRLVWQLSDKRSLNIQGGLRHYQMGEDDLSIPLGWAECSKHSGAALAGATVWALVDLADHDELLGFFLSLCLFPECAVTWERGRHTCAAHVSMEWRTSICSPNTGDHVIPTHCFLHCSSVLWIFHCTKPHLLKASEARLIFLPSTPVLFGGTHFGNPVCIVCDSRIEKLQLLELFW